MLQQTMGSMRLQPMQKSKHPKPAECEGALRSSMSAQSAAKQLPKTHAADSGSIAAAHIAPLFSVTCPQRAASACRQAIPAERRPAAANPAASELDQPKAEPLPAAMGKQVEQPFGTATIDISEDPDEPAPHSKAPGPPAAQDDSETESMPLPGSPLPEDDVPSSEPHHQQHQQGDAQPAEQPVEQGATVVHTGAVAEHSADPGASDMQIDLEQERAGLSQGARMAESQPSNGDAAAASEAALGAEERTVPSQQAAAAGAQTAMPAEEDSCAAAAEEAAVAGREAEWYSPAAWGDAVVGRQPPPAVEPTAGRLVPPPQPAASQNGRNHEHPAHPAGPENADWGPTSERGADGGAPPQDAATPAAGWPAEQPPAVSGANQRLQHRSAAALQPHLLSRKRKHAKKKNWEDLQNGGNQEGLPNGSKALGVNGHFPQESARASGWDPLHNLIPQRSWGSSTRARRGHSPPRSRWSQRQEAARDARPPANVADEALESLAAHQPDGSAQPDAAGRANGQRGGRGARGRGRAGRLSRRLAGAVSPATCRGSQHLLVAGGPHSRDARAGPEATPGMRACIDQLKAIYGSDPEEGAERGAAHAPEVRAPAAEPQAAAAL